MLLNASGGFPEQSLIDAALYGVPCIGAGASEVQHILWPELVAEDPVHTTELARRLLTNAARLRRIAARAREACREIYAPSEEEAAAWLRQLHAAQASPALASTR